MAVRIPKRITIGPYSFTVSTGGPRWAKHLADHRSETGDPNAQLHGRTDLNAGSIGISPGQSADVKRDTLLHEVLHGCFFAAGGFPDNADDLEEAVIRTLSPFLLEVLRQNPTLVDYLLRR